MQKIIVAAIMVIALTGCASPPPPKVWVRTDGKVMSGNPALEQQATLDKTICNGEAQKANLSAGTNYSGGLLVHSIEENRREQASGGVFEGCMAAKGYVLTTADNAQTLSDSLAATARERQKLAGSPPPAVTAK